MARRTVTILTCDITGDMGDETVPFGLDGVAYEIDLTTVMAKELRHVLAPFVERARRVKAGTVRRKPLQGHDLPRNTREIRAWARGKGITVNDHGRLSTAVIEQYEAAHGAKK